MLNWHKHICNMQMTVLRDVKSASSVIVNRQIRQFTFMHLADAFIQSTCHCIQAIHFLSAIQYFGYRLKKKIQALFISFVSLFIVYLFCVVLHYYLLILNNWKISESNVYIIEKCLWRLYAIVLILICQIIVKICQIELPLLLWQLLKYLLLYTYCLGCI